MAENKLKISLSTDSAQFFLRAMDVVNELAESGNNFETETEKINNARSKAIGFMKDIQGKELQLIIG